jgi:DNA-binding transcriptional ArsR family regulator
MSKVVQLRRVDAADRFRDRLMTARAILRALADEEEVSEAVLVGVSDLAEDLVKAVEEFRHE